MQNLKRVKNVNHHLSFNDLLKLQATSRFYFSLSASVASFSYLLMKCKNSRNEVLRMGAAGSLTNLLVETLIFPIDAINLKSKVVLNKNVPFKEMLLDVLHK